MREFVREIVESARPGDRPALKPLDAAADRFTASADAAGRRMDALLAGASTDEKAAAALNRALMNTERAFLHAEGIPGRPWYRHLIYAPKPTYAPEVLPGVAEAMAAGDRKRIDAQVANLVGRARSGRGRAAARPPGDALIRGNKLGGHEGHEDHEGHEEEESFLSGHFETKFFVVTFVPFAIFVVSWLVAAS